MADLMDNHEIEISLETIGIRILFDLDPLFYTDAQAHEFGEMLCRVADRFHKLVEFRAEHPDLYKRQLETANFS